MTVDFFFYGTLRDAEVRRLVLGPGALSLSVTPAALPGYRCGPCEQGRFPGIVAEEGASAPGLIARNAPLEAAARTSYFEGDGYDYDIAPLPIVHEDGTSSAAWVYVPRATLAVDVGVWSLEDWARRWRRDFLAGSRQAMTQMTAADLTRHRQAWIRRLSRSPGS